MKSRSPAKPTSRKHPFASQWVTEFVDPFKASLAAWIKEVETRPIVATDILRLSRWTALVAECVEIHAANKPPGSAGQMLAKLNASLVSRPAGKPLEATPYYPWQERRAVEAAKTWRGGLRRTVSLFKQAHDLPNFDKALEPIYFACHTYKALLSGDPEKMPTPEEWAPPSTLRLVELIASIHAGERTGKYACDEGLRRAHKQACTLADATPQTAASAPLRRPRL